VNNHNIQVFLFVLLLVSTTLFPSVHLAHAEPVLVVLKDQTVSIADLQSSGGLIIESGGHLIIERDGDLSNNGNFVNRGTITIDGNFKQTGFIFNFGNILVQCGIIDPTSDFDFIGNPIESVDCTAGLKETSINNLVVESDETFTVPKNEILILSGDVKIFGTLVNNGIIQNFATINLEGGGLRNTGTITNVCGNLGISSITGDGNLLNTGTITNTECLAPHAQDDSYPVDEDMTLVVDGALLLGVLDNDVDLDTDHSELTASARTETAKDGTIFMNNDGTFEYSPDDDFYGTDTFSYRVEDGTGGFDTATVTITVKPLNDDPVGDAQLVTTLEDEDLPITLTGSDVDGDSLSFTTTEPSNGSLSGTAPNITYNPNDNYNGPDSFDFTVDDGNGGTNTATVTITVTPVDDSPTADAQSVTTPEDEDLPITLTGSDVDGDSLSFTTTEPSNGSLSGTAPNITYNPNDNYNGPDSFDFTVDDGTGRTDTATVTITVESINDKVVANDDTYSVNEDETLTISAPGILMNDDNVDGDVLTTTIVSLPTSTSDFVFNGDGGFTYTPITDFFGTDTFVYKIDDGLGEFDTATVTITIMEVILDTTAPVLTIPSDVTLEAPADTTPGSTGIATAKDDVDPSPTVTFVDVEELDSQGLGTITRTWTATDASSNSASADQIVTLVDITDPTIELTTPEVTIEIIGTKILSSEVELGSATAEDNIDPAPTITNVVPEFFLLGENTVTWTATDASGNSVDALQSVIVTSTSLLEQKTSIIDDLEQLIDEAKDKKTIKELEKAVKDLNKTTKEKGWESHGNQLTEKKGEKIFKDQKKGIKHILKVLKNGDNEDPLFTLELSYIATELLGIDEQLSINAYLEALESGDKFDEKKAEQEFNKAQKDLEKQKLDKAVDHFKKSWKASFGIK